MKNAKQLLFAATILSCLTVAATAFASPTGFSLVVDSFKHEVNSFLNAGPDPGPFSSSDDLISNFSSFHFLSPIAPSAGDPSKFDASLLNSLRVEICQVGQSGCTLVKTFTSAGALSEQLRIETTPTDGSYYIANWDTQKVRLNNQTYRITVSISCLVLGSVDLTPAIYTRFGRTWPIKFLIEKDSNLRFIQLRSLGRSASQVASVLKNEFGLSAEQIRDLLLSGCDPYTADQADIAIKGVFQDVIMPDTTKVADETTRNALLSFDPSTCQMIFISGSTLLGNLKTGDVLVSEPGPAAPYGYLRKVNSVRKQRGFVTVETSQASLTEAFYKGTLDAAGELLPDDLVSSEAMMPGVTFQKAASSDSKFTAPQATGGYNFETTFDVTIDGNTGDGDFNGTGNVHITGRVLFNAGYDLGVGAEFCAHLPPVCVDRVEGHVGIQQYSEVHVDGRLDATLHKEYVVARHFFQPFVFFVGPIPVIIVPVVNLVVGVDGEAHFTFTFDASLASDFSVGAKWLDDGQGWRPDSHFTAFPVDPSAHANVTADMRITAYGRGNAKLLLYGVAGPGIGADLGGGAHFKIPVQTPGDPVWSVFAHLAGDVFFQVDIIDVIRLSDFNAHVLFQEQDIIKAPNFPPQFSEVSTNIILARVNTPTYIGPSGGLDHGFYKVIDPESEGAPTLTAKVGDVQLAGFPNVTFTEPGNKTVTITATDVHGATSSIDLKVFVFVPPTSLELWPSATTIPAGVQFFATITAHDDADTPIPCSSLTLNLQVTAPDVASRHGGAGNCVALVRFNQQGNRTLTVTATDAYGTPTTKSVTVNVTAPPANPYPEIAEGDLITFSVMSRQGPLSNVCPDPTYLCEAPSDVYFFNGMAGSGDYHIPLFMSLSTTDPTDSVSWRCETGTAPAAVTYDSTFDLQTCSPGPSLTERVKVYAIVTDVNGQSIRSESRVYRFLPGGPH